MTYTHRVTVFDDLYAGREKSTLYSQINLHKYFHAKHSSEIYKKYTGLTATVSKYHVYKANKVNVNYITQFNKA